MKQALQATVNTNYNLHSNFDEQAGTLQQIIHDHVQAVLEEHTVEKQIESKAIVQKTITQPFDLAKDALFRFALINSKYNQTVTLLVVFHHIILDGTQYGKLMQCISNNYHHAPDLNITDKDEINHLEDYIAWEEEKIKNADVQYWVSKLKKYPLNNNLPYQTIEIKRTQLKQVSKLYELDNSLYSKLSSFSKKMGIPYSILLKQFGQC